MTVREGGHEFNPGVEVRLGSDGRRYVLCRECKQSKRAAPHQPVDPRTRARTIRPWGPNRPPGSPPPTNRGLIPHSRRASLQPEPELRPRPYVEPREVKMLRLAIDAVLDRTDIGWTLRQRAIELRRACDLPPDEKPEPVAPVGAPPAKTTLGSQKGTARWVRKAISGAYWPLAQAALDQGFTPERRGNGHVRFARGARSFSLSTTVTEGRGRGFENAKAAARRAGVEV